jgi:hypothetical protein
MSVLPASLCVTSSAPPLHCVALRRLPLTDEVGGLATSIVEAQREIDIKRIPNLLND